MRFTLRVRCQREGVRHQDPIEVRNCFTTKDTKSTKESEDKVLNPALKFGGIAQLLTRCDSSSNSILRVLRGEFSVTSGLASQPASVPCEPKLEVTIYSKRQGTTIE